MNRLLVVDDEQDVLQQFEAMLTAEGYDVVTASNADAAFGLLDEDEFELVVLDVHMPGTNGLDALKRIKQTNPKLPVIITTGHGTMETAVEAAKRGAFEYFLKPFEAAEMLRTIDKALQSAKLMKGYVALSPEQASTTAEAIIGRSHAMQEVYKAIGRVAATDATVLVRGESGTGKELVVRAIYQHSLRSDAPLAVVNCVAIPETLLESELFGYEKGAFTGADSRRIGKFQQADGGTIFLDEIGDIPLPVQAKILRVLQEKQFERLGGNQSVSVDVRVLTATNRDLEIAIGEGGFREDLYHRLNVVTIHVPPLRERREDIPLLVDYFLARSANELKVEEPPVAADAMALLRAYKWPGNVRELQHCIQRAMIYSRGHPIQSADLHLSIDPSDQISSLAAGGADEDVLRDLVRQHLNDYEGDRAHEKFLEFSERMLIVEALQRTKGNQTRAAELLGLARPTLHAKIKRHGLQSGDEESGG